MFIPLGDSIKLKSIRFQRVTLALIVANVLVFVAQLALPGSDDAVYAALGFVPDALFGDAPAPEGWRLPAPVTLITHTFIHGDAWHLAGNMLFLWIFGDNVEDALGHVRFALFYFICAAAAALAQGWLGAHPEAPFIGASGAVSACFGAYVLFYPRARVWILLLMRIPLPMPAFFVGVLWIATQLLFLALGTEPFIAWSGHIAGFVAGMLLGALLQRLRPALPAGDLPRS